MDLNSVIESIHASRKYFLNHIKGLRQDQWDWKPFPECKSIGETLAHLIADDRAAIHILETGQFPDFGSILEHAPDPIKLQALLTQSHENLVAFLLNKFSDTSLDTPVNYFEGVISLSQAILGISSEDYYHAGQVAFIRLATDPQWDYYQQVYGWGE